VKVGIAPRVALASRLTLAWGGIVRIVPGDVMVGIAALQVHAMQIILAFQESVTTRDPPRKDKVAFCKFRYWKTGKHGRVDNRVLPVIPEF